MTIYLIFISFLLHGVSFFAVILLLQRQKELKKTEQNIKQMMNEAEHMMTAFVVEIKEENETLIKQLSKAQPKTEKQSEAADQSLLAGTSGAEKTFAAVTPRQTAVHAYTAQQPKQEKLEKTKTLSLNEQILRLNKQGMSEEEIARTLKIGRTEVKLGLKFNEPK